MEHPESETDLSKHAIYIEGVDFAEKPPEFGQPAVLFLRDLDSQPSDIDPMEHLIPERDLDSQPSGIDPMEHLIPETIGLTLSYNNSTLTLETPFSDKPGSYVVDDYITVTGTDLETLIRISTDQARSDNPYLRANAVMMSGIASLLGLESDNEATATQCLDWTVRHEGAIDHDGMVAILYAYINTRQEQYVETVIRNRLEQNLALQRTLYDGSMTAAYVTVMAGPDASTLAQLTVLSDLLKKT